MNADAAKAGLETLEGLMGNTQKVLRGLIAENKKLREMAEFYENPNNWRQTGESIQRFDRGQKARDCLSFCNESQKASGEIARICD